MDHTKPLLMTDNAVDGKNRSPIMRQCERREWWLWSSAVFVTILLTVCIASFALLTIASGNDSFRRGT